MFRPIILLFLQIFITISPKPIITKPIPSYTVIYPNDFNFQITPNEYFQSSNGPIFISIQSILPEFVHKTPIPSKLETTFELYNLPNIQDVIKIFVEDEFAYVADRGNMSGLYIINISDVNNLKIESVVDSGNQVFGNGVNDVFVFDNFAYACDGESGFKIFDVSNKKEPIQIGWVDNIYAQNAHVKPGENYAYVTSRADGLHIVDITNKHNPVLKGNFGALLDARSIIVVDNIAYIADYGFATDRLKTIDVSDKDNPFLINGILSPFFNIVHGLFSDGNGKLLVADGAVTILDISDTGNVGFKPLPANIFTMARSAVLYGNYIFVADHFDGLDIIDFTDQDNPSLFVNVDSPDNEASTECVFIRGNYAYISYRNKGLGIVSFPGGIELEGSTERAVGEVFVKIVADDGTGSIFQEFIIDFVCDIDWFGENCSIPFTCNNTKTSSPEVCSSHGQCIEPDLCECNENWGGEDCERCFSEYFDPNEDCSLCLDGYYNPFNMDECIYKWYTIIPAVGSVSVILTVFFCVIFVVLLITLLRKRHLSKKGKDTEKPIKIEEKVKIDLFSSTIEEVGLPNVENGEENPNSVKYNLLSSNMPDVELPDVDGSKKDSQSEEKEKVEP